MNRQQMLKNRAFSAVYEAQEDGKDFSKGDIVGVVNTFAWLPLDKKETKLAVGRYFPFDKTLFESSSFIQLRGKITALDSRKRWWSDGKGKQKPVTFSSKFNKSAKFTSQI